MREARSGAVSGVAGSIATLAILLQSPTALGQTAQDPQPPTTTEPSSDEPADATPVDATPVDATAPDAVATEPSDPPELEPLPAVEPRGDSGGIGFGEAPRVTTATAPAEPTAPESQEEADPNRIFAEDWWTHTRPTLELHGNFRVRLQLMHHFSLGRIDSPENAMWPRPADDFYTDINGQDHGARVCTPAEAGVVGGSESPANADSGCSNPTQAGGNMRFRIEPAIIISDNLRVRSQIDLFDNLALGSTPSGYGNLPSSSGYSVASRDGYTPVSGMTATQNSPISGINSVSDAVSVRRAWAEYETPFGQARFGRMPDHWGLGLFHNAGDDIDGDAQSTVDRVAFFSGLPSLSLFAGLAWDFPYEGPTSQGFAKPGVPAYDLAQYDDVSQMNLLLFRRVDPQLQKLMLARGDVVVNGGLYLTYSFQRIANDVSGPGANCAQGADALGCGPGQASAGFTRRGMEVWTPDLFAEVKYKKFHFAAEAVSHLGTFQSLAVQPGDNDYTDPSAAGQDGWRVNQWGFASEITQRLVEDRLKLGFYFGWGSGDGDVDGLVPGNDGLQNQNGNRSLDTFRFHPGYRVDLILNRNILSRVQGSYYFKPMAQYDFIRNATGMRLGGRAEAIWTRASNFMQAPGHQADLGIELNGTVYFQSKDGVLNDDPDLVGGLYAMIQYGVLFPMSGLGYLSQQTPAAGGPMPGLETAQTVRMFLGVAY